MYILEYDYPVAKSALARLCPATAILLSYLCSAACNGESQPRPTPDADAPSAECDGAESCLVGDQGTCSRCCCPIRGTRYELPADLGCKQQVLEGTLECYARAGSLADFPDVCGSSPVAVCLQRRVGEKIEVQFLPAIPIGWSGMSSWEYCSGEAGAAASNGSPCE